MNNTPLVSICVPIYGVEMFIERCVRSLFEQSYPNIEYIFINDATPDNSMKVLSDVICNYPNRQSQVKIINLEENHGLAYVRNKAVRNANGEFILHVDSDDYIEFDTVERCIKKQIETDSDIVTFNYNYCRKTGILEYKFPVFNSAFDRTLALLSRSIAICVWAAMYRKKLYDNVDAIVTDGVNYSEDYNITPILSYNSKKVIHINKALYNYNVANENSYTYHFQEKNKRQLWKTFEKLTSFFCDKNPLYIDAIEKSKLFSIVDCLLICNEKNNHDEFIDFLLIKLDEINKKYWRYLPLRKYLFLRAYRTKTYSILSKKIKFIYHKYRHRFKKDHM